uniref:G-patch domain-containing protein n=1 Tax=Caenorhabditis tropicalis TaxID=1561998 RepID=A0A1I7SY02_9PELO
MGYKVGEGLGKRNDGIVHAIQARICAKNASLDEVMIRKRKVIDGNEKPKKVRKLNTTDDSERDIFAFINRKLEKKAERTYDDIRKEKIEMAGYSSKTLGAKNIDLESELKQLVMKKRKLKDGIDRNRNDKNTVIKMKCSLKEIDEQIASVNRKLNRIQNEVSSRNSKRKDEF